MDIARELGVFISNLKFKLLPREVVQKAKIEFLDFLGVSLYGYNLKNHLPFMKACIQESTSGNMTVIGEGKRFSVYQAIFLNSILAHSTAYESGSRFAAVHPASVVIPVAMALCEKNNASGKDFITALVAGYELMIRIGEAINPSAIKRGFHPTGITGPFGSAATAAKIQSLSSSEAWAALNIAASQGAGLVRAYDAAGSQPLHSGSASVTGVLSAQLGGLGVEGPSGIISQSFLKAHTDEYSLERVLDNLGSDYQIRHTYIKIHGGCRHIHAPIDAASAIIKENNISVDDIEKIKIRIYKVAKEFEKEHPTTIGDALFSTPFGIALMLLEGDAFIDRFSEQNLSRPEIQEVMRKVEVVGDPEWDKVYPQKRGCRCDIYTKGNKRYSLRLNFAKGEPEFPFMPDEVKEKYMRLATPVMGTSKAEKIYACIQEVDQLNGFSELMALLR